MKAMKHLLMFMILVICHNSFAQCDVYRYTGALQLWTVPAGVDTIRVKMWGAAGGGGPDTFSSAGGGGGYTEAVIPVDSGQVFQIYVGEGGKAANAQIGGAGGWPNGGNGGSGNRIESPPLGLVGGSGGGGGRSEIRVDGILYVIAGGGGGGACNRNGGAGGGLEAEYTATSNTFNFFGRGGNQTVGGAPAANIFCGNPVSGTAGASFLGGTGATDLGGILNDRTGGGGGGDGYFGGGGGSSHDGCFGVGSVGGGGSGYICTACPGVVGFTLTQTSFGLPGFPANESDSLLSSYPEVAKGSNNEDGGNGLVEICYTSTIVCSPITFFSQAISICSGDTFYFYGNRYYTGGIYYDTFTNYLGCDSIVNTTLTVKPLLSAGISYTICYEDSFFAHGAWRNRTGIYIDTLLSSLGCDSFYSIILTVRPLVITNVNISRCVGDSFLCGGKYQKLTGIYNDTFTNILGCDSILQTNLVMNPAIQDTVFKNICITDSFFCAQNYQRTTGIYIDSLINSNGCDSILYTSLVVYNLPLISVTPDTIICISESASLRISTNTPCTFQWNNGATTAAILVNPFVPTNYIVTATDSLGCKSKDSVSIDLYPLPLVDVTDTTICFGQSAKLSAIGGVSYVWSTDATTSTISMTPANTTSYTVTVTDSNNCKSDAIGIVTVNNLIVNIDAVPDSMIRRGETIVLHAIFSFAATSIFWTPSFGLSTTDSAYTIANTQENTSYVVIITDSFGCKAIDSVSIYIIPEEIVLVPTGFSPNGDGVNDMLNVTLSPNLTLQEFRIYNRWGEEVFNYPKDNRGKSWDGMYRERVQPISTYVWVVVAKNKVSGNVVNYNGNVTLLR
jgi:gliding motility-associated-like protein